jgi:WXXGXW repeat (2 copies)
VSIHRVAHAGTRHDSQQIVRDTGYLKMARYVRFDHARCLYENWKIAYHRRGSDRPFLIAAAHVDFGIAVGTPPPFPPVAVAVTPTIAAPGSGYVWVPAHWDWVDGRWVWIDGRWMLPPHPHAV